MTSLELWNPIAEHLSGKALQDLHLTKLRALLSRVHNQSPYYRDKIAKAGFDATQLQSLEEYSRYPTFDKYEERESQARSRQELGHPLGLHLTCDIRDVNRMSASSGTSGTPSFQGHTRNDRRHMNENFARLCRRIGLEPGHRVMHAGVMSMWVAGIPIIDGLMDYGCNVIPIGALVGSAKVMEMAELTRPHAIVGTPSFFRHMIAKSNGLGIDLKRVGIEKVVVYGEPGGSIPEVIQELSEGFGGARIYDIGGGTSCLNPIFVSCEAHAGMHMIAPDHAYVEVRDVETGTMLPIEEGVEGEFLYTGLDRECGPLLRFRDGDRMRITTAPCTCGRPGWRVHILGRVDDMLLLKGVNVFPSAIRDVALSLKPAFTGNIRVLKFSASPVVEPPLQVHAELGGDPAPELWQALKVRLEDEIQRRLRFKAEVTLFAEGQLALEVGATQKTHILKKMY